MFRPFAWIPCCALLLAGCGAPRPGVAEPKASAQKSHITVASVLVSPRLVHQVKPRYPKALRDAGVQGVVRITALVGKDGRVTPRKVVSGPEQLRPLALDAVRQWVYEPTLLNGEPVEVITQIDINFTKNQ